MPIAVAQGVADYLSTGAATDERLVAYVARINGRDDARPVTVVLADGSLVGADQPGCSDPDADGDNDGVSGGDTDEDGGASGLAPTTAAEVVEVTDGRLLRIEAAVGGGSVQVCAFVSDRSVTETVGQRLLLLGGAAVLVLAVVAGLAVVVTRRITRPLVATSQTADRLAEGDLEARAVDDGPLEVRRVGAALNRLAERIEDLLQHERETVADLSHRLRTPLTAVRLDVEALADGPGKVRLESSLAQVERTLTSVIQAARRLDRAALAQAEVVAVVRERFDFWSPLLEEQDRAPRSWSTRLPTRWSPSRPTTSRPPSTRCSPTPPPTLRTTRRSGWSWAWRALRRGRRGRPGPGHPGVGARARAAATAGRPVSASTSPARPRRRRADTCGSSATARGTSCGSSSDTAPAHDDLGAI